jgi:hypothetical protein
MRDLRKIELTKRADLHRFPQRRDRHDRRMVFFDYMERFRSRTGVRTGEHQEGQQNSLNHLAESNSDLSITYIDDNSVHVRDTLGHELAFQYPLGNISLKDHDGFIEQMSDRSAPLPAIERLVMAVSKALIDPLKAIEETNRPNSGASGQTIETLARWNGVDPERLVRMLMFARQRLYERFKARLRDSVSGQ